jgi:hypothetical protein
LDSDEAEQGRTIFQATAFRFAFENDLETSRVYKRTQHYSSDVSFTSSAVRTHAWSIFSGLSLADVSVISAIALPLYSCDISNSQWYKFGESGQIDLQRATPTLPATPNASSEALVPTPADSVQPSFHHFLRALYPYNPTTANSSSTITLPLNEGDVILVHSIHTSGWADGTLLISGVRGWLPANYCETYDPEMIRNLLNALLNLRHLQCGSIGVNIDVLSNRECVLGIIAGVRHLLVSRIFVVASLHHLHYASSCARESGTGKAKGGG